MTSSTVSMTDWFSKRDTLRKETKMMHRENAVQKSAIKCFYKVPWEKEEGDPKFKHAQKS